MTGTIPKGQLTAWQRWELAAFDEAEQAALQAAKVAARAAEEVAVAKAKAALRPKSKPALSLPTAAEIEKMYADAREEGYAAGHAEGLAAGREEGLAAGREEGLAVGNAEGQAAAQAAGQTRADEVVARLDSVLTGVYNSISGLDQQVADELLKTALEIANQLMSQSLQVKPELLLPVVREAIAALHPHPGHPLLHVHPDDAELVRASLGEQLTHKNWHIVEDREITPGGCRIEHGGSEVDATRETRWRRVLSTMGVSEAWFQKAL